MYQNINTNYRYATINVCVLNNNFYSIDSYSDQLLYMILFNATMY